MFPAEIILNITRCAFPGRKDEESEKIITGDFLWFDKVLTLFGNPVLLLPEKIL